MPFIEIQKSSFHFLQSGNQGQATILIHELGGNAESWRDHINMNSYGGHMFAFDIAGSGLSEKKVEHSSIDMHADNLAAVILHLGCAPVDIIGIAFGALIGLAFGRRHPQLLRRAIFANCTDHIDEQSKTYVLSRAAKVRSEGMRSVIDQSMDNSFPKGFENEKEKYRHIFLANDPQIYADMSEALVEFSFNFSDGLAFNNPVLFLAGEQDFIWGPFTVDRVARLIPKAEMKILKNAGHLAHWQTTEHFVAETRTFLNSI
jgi:3-oxoadipate enol-lactonase